MDIKIQNAIAFLAASFKEKAGRPISQTFLYKLLAYVDFTSLKKYGIPTLGLKYVAMDRGPVPIEIYNEIKEQNKFITFEVIDKKTETYPMKLIEPLIKADLDYFNQDDVDMMRSIINEHVNDSSKAEDISNRSHDDIKSWKKAYYGNGPDSPMDYADEFESLENLPHEVELFLLYKELKK